MPREIAWKLEGEIVKVDPAKAKEIRIAHVAAEKFFAEQNAKRAEFRRQARAEVE